MDTTSVTIHLTDPQEIEDFKQFRQHKQETLVDDILWKELKKYCKDIQYGTFNLAIKDGKPYKITRSLQTMVFGVQLN